MSMFTLAEMLSQFLLRPVTGGDDEQTVDSKHVAYVADVELSLFSGLIGV